MTTSDDPKAMLARLRVTEVRPLEIPDDTYEGSWHCNACEAPYPVHDGWLVSGFGAVGRADHIVCPDCAREQRHRIRARRTVLVIDDDADYRQDVRAWLEEGDLFEVCGERGTVADAVTAIEDCAPDLVLLDLRLPDGDAFELLTHLAERQLDTPVVVITAYPNGDAERTSRRLGSRRFLDKSVHRAASLVLHLDEV